jgi:hypothetical protein
MAAVSQAIFDDLLKQKAIAADGKSVIRVSADGVGYPEGEVFTVEKAVEPPKENTKPVEPVQKKTTPKEVKSDATNPSSV